ncbi:mechanosensitive ion channel protein MscS [Salinibacter sp. 10B]|uniref:mechanosensitive ion channel family protein n=1 Tax=Salinibacter sp. 10B TaxID=1923971 RepID=UPI000CF3EE54|nr:mechanosensitive ion channel domain-containing protein [Salinibacter sp. 10B]PQJ34166.1 mechanosensitive ion channel protein MscS [Salinibacter sp. 10B]
MNELFSQGYLSAETLNMAANYLLKGVAFIIILVVGRYIARWVRDLIRGGLDAPGADRTLTKFVGNFAYYGIFLLALFAGLETVGVETASFVAVLAAASFAVGLALQGTLANFAAGIMLLVFRPFSVGDYVDIAGETGFVREIQLFFTQLRTRDNRLIIVPNGDIFGATIENIFAYDEIRVDCDVGTDYPADIDETREVLLDAARSVDDRIEEKGEQAALVELGGSSINWQVRIWAEPDNYFRLKQELTRQVKYKLDEADIGIPFPQMDVHLDELNGEA